MSKNLGPAAMIRRKRLSEMNQRRHLDRGRDSRRVEALEWVAGGDVYAIPLDPRRHLRDEFDREHYGGFVMPFETELNPENFARDSIWDPFIGNPGFYQKRGT